LLGEQAVVVEPLVLPRPALEGRVGLRPRDQALVDGEALENPPGRIVPRAAGVADAERPQFVARLEPAGAAPDDDDVVVARRKRLRVYWRHSSALRSRSASAWSRG